MYVPALSGPSCRSDTFLVERDEKHIHELNGHSTYQFTVCKWVPLHVETGGQRRSEAHLLSTRTKERANKVQHLVPFLSAVI